SSMSYPIPLQIHVIWHPGSEDICFPLAKQLYVALNRDSYQPLALGIGIPVFFRCAGADAKRPNDIPAPIAVPDTEYDLRIALTAPKLLLDQAWCKYVADNFSEVAGKRDRATILAFGKPLPNSAVKAVVMDLKDERAGEQILQHVLLQAC